MFGFRKELRRRMDAVEDGLFKTDREARNHCHDKPKMYFYSDLDEKLAGYMSGTSSFGVYHDDLIREILCHLGIEVKEVKASKHFELVKKEVARNPKADGEEGRI